MPGFGRPGFELDTEQVLHQAQNAIPGGRVIEILADFLGIDLEFLSVDLLLQVAVLPAFDALGSGLILAQAGQQHRVFPILRLGGVPGQFLEEAFHALR